MASARILVVDDEQGMLEVCADTLAALDDAEVLCEANGARALERLNEEPWDLLITDLRMPGVNGLDLLARARVCDPHLPVLIITAFPSVDTAVATMKQGAADYVIKPFLPDDLLATVTRLLQARKLREENQLLMRQLDREFVLEDLIGESRAMQELIESVRAIAPSGADVLITGETGTGKELVARSLHQLSARREGKFVPVDCGAIPEELMESEFFGHERGAFTGATDRSLGLLEFADGGTFFLDEVGELSPRLQAKLLRALQERRIRRVGGTREIAIDVRVIAATSRDLEADIEAGRFRDDLYYRINVANIVVAPLRERADDIPLLADYFLARYSAEMGRPAAHFDGSVSALLSAYAWPGNVRQLQNVIKRAIAMSRTDEIGAEALPEQIRQNAPDVSDPSGMGFFDHRDHSVAEFERNYLIELLRSSDGNVTAASESAKLPRGTLYRLLKRHGLSATDFRR